MLYLKSIAICFIMISLIGCGSSEINSSTKVLNNPETNTSFSVTSDAVVNGELLDQYKCEKKVDGVENSLPLQFSNIPNGTGSLAVVMYHYPNPEDTQHDPNTYLFLWGIDPSITEIGYGEADDGSWYMGPNKDGFAISYTSPCSQSPGSHEYTIKVYALSQTPPSLPIQNSLDITYTTFTDAMNEVTIIDTAKLVFSSVTP